MLFSRDDNVLARFTRDLTTDARNGRLEPIRCRTEEISRVIDILLRHGKNTPALVGPPGVGKTAIAEGLAQRIAADAVPLGLRGTRLLALDHVSLLAGTTYRGQYEERVRGLVAETSAAADVVLFIDELHNLIGQGTAMGVAMDAGNMLKPALVRGEFRVIGATTDDEYNRWVRSRRAQVEDDDTLDRFARGSAAARERFGAELEAMFVGVPVEEGAGAPTRTSTEPEVESASPRSSRATNGARLAELEAELNRRLMDEGVVVRGQDVARVVALAVGVTVRWPS